LTFVLIQYKKIQEDIELLKHVSKMI